MPIALFLIGIPYSGKSTFVNTLFPDIESRDDWVLISSDYWIEKEADEQGKDFNEVFQDQIKIATEKMYDDLVLAKLNKQNIIWDQTNIDEKTRWPKISKLDSYTIIAINFSPPEDLKERQEKREKKISDSLIASFAKRYQEPRLSEGFDYVFQAKDIEEIQKLISEFKT